MQIGRPAGYKSLPEYIQSQAGHSQEMADIVRDATISMVEYLANAMAGVRGTSKQTALELLEELRLSLDALQHTIRRQAWAPEGPGAARSYAV